MLQLVWCLHWVELWACLFPLVRLRSDHNLLSDWIIHFNVRRHHQSHIDPVHCFFKASKLSILSRIPISRTYWKSPQTQKILSSYRKLKVSLLLPLEYVPWPLLLVTISAAAHCWLMTTWWHIIVCVYLKISDMFIHCGIFIYLQFWLNLDKRIDKQVESSKF